MPRAAPIVVASLAAAVACRHPPPPPPPPAELAVPGVAAIAGAWVTSDDQDFSYRLEIQADGAYRLHVDRNRLGACDIAGTLSAGTAPRTFALVYAEHQCQRELSHTATTLAVTSFTGDALAIAVTTPEGAFRRTFARAPRQ